MFIQLAEALQQMQATVKGRAIPFSVSFWTADKAKNNGGELLELTNVTLNRIGKATTKEETTSSISSPLRKANHYVNATRNFLLPNGQIRKAHIRLIHSFNGQEVHW